VDCFVIADGDDWTRNILLLKAGEHNILVDTGLGPDWEPVPARLMERLAAINVPATAIDIVVLSHADWDHIAGAVLASGELAFPNARYIMHRQEWAFWASRPERHPPSAAYDDDFRRRASTFPLTRLAELDGHLELIEAETEIAPGVRLIAAPGHTPGHMLVALSSEGQQLLNIADLLVSDPTVLQDPDWFSVYDYDREKAKETRHNILAMAAESQALLMAYHVPFPGLGYVRPQGRGWRWETFRSV